MDLEKSKHAIKYSFWIQCLIIMVLGVKILRQTDSKNERNIHQNMSFSVTILFDINVRMIERINCTKKF